MLTELELLVTCLFLMVSSVHTNWLSNVCENIYNVEISCLESPFCIKQFKKCLCVPADSLDEHNNPPDLFTVCMLSYMWNTGEPTCCFATKRNEASPRILPNWESGRGFQLPGTIEKKQHDLIHSINAILSNDDESMAAKHGPNTNRITNKSYGESVQKSSSTDDAMSRSLLRSRLMQLLFYME